MTTNDDLAVAFFVILPILVGAGALLGGGVGAAIGMLAFVILLAAA